MMAPVGGSLGTPWWGDLSQSDNNLETFKYDHPLTPLVLLVSKTLEVQCPGCGDMKRMLVRHLKTDQTCAGRCSSIDMESFDHQLKRFRHRRQMKESKQRKREESEAVMAEYKKRRREERLLEATGYRMSKGTNEHYRSTEKEEKHKNGSSAKEFMEMRFHNEYPSKSYAEREDKQKDRNCDHENKFKRDISDNFQSPPNKLSKVEHKEKHGEGVHILTIGEFVKKEEHRSPSESQDGMKESQQENLGKEADKNLEATLDSRPTVPTSPCSAPSVQNSLSPAQMVEVNQLQFASDKI